MGFTIARAYWGQGYGTEAAEALVRFVFDQLKVVRIEALCLPENLASARVLQKIGMQYEGLLHNYQVWKDQPSDLQMYGITNPDLRW
jgi:ribosomal-protein-alanine N-acetyltransferase